MMLFARLLWLHCVAIACAEVTVARFGQQFGNANKALVNHVFPYAIRHGCVLRLTDDIEADQLKVARAIGKCNGHAPSGQVVPLSERYFDFTRRGQPEPPACNVTLRSARDWYVEARSRRRLSNLTLVSPSEHEAAKAKSAVHRVFGINSTHAFGRDCAAPPYLAVHVRSGDVFQGVWDEDGSWRPANVHPGYGQPSLSYYVRCIAAAQRDDVRRKIVLCEDFRNPVCLALRTMSPLVDGLSVQRLSLLETLQTLGCASHICTAVGTFSAIAANSFHNRNHIMPQKGTDTKFPAAVMRLEPASGAMRPIEFICDAKHTDGELWPSRNTTQVWKNTCLQREGMLL